MLKKTVIINIFAEIILIIIFHIFVNENHFILKYIKMYYKMLKIEKINSDNNKLNINK